MTDTGCVFCFICKGDIPSFKVYEDDATLAFMDINPLTEGHLLVIPKQHFENIWDADPAVLGKIMETVQKMALLLREKMGIDSLNLVQANGIWAVQSVPHFHMHLIPRREGDNAGIDWGLTQGDLEEIKVLADKLVG